MVNNAAGTMQHAKKEVLETAARGVDNAAPLFGQLLGMPTVPDCLAHPVMSTVSVFLLVTTSPPSKKMALCTIACQVGSVSKLALNVDSVV